MKLTHPDAPGAAINPKADHAEAYLSQGWTEQAEKPADEKPKK